MFAHVMFDQSPFSAVCQSASSLPLQGWRPVNTHAQRGNLEIIRILIEQCGHAADSGAVYLFSLTPNFITD